MIGCIFIMRTFTGQYGKFFRSYRNAPWYIETVKMNEAMAAELGFKKVVTDEISGC